MGEKGASARRTTRKLHELGFTHVLMIPDSESRLLYEALERDERIDLITPCREGESVAIAAGLWTGGQKPLLVIQNTGLMEAGDALRGCGTGPGAPLRMMVGWRGYGGATAGKLPIDSAYAFTEPLLEAWRIPTWRLMSDDDLGALDLMDEAAASASYPAAVLAGYGFRP